MRGTLTCDPSSQTYFSSVECNQTCFGAIPASCAASDGSSGGGGSDGGGADGGGEGSASDGGG